MNLILIPSRPPLGELVVLTGSRASHAVSVLRVAPGQSVRVGIEDGPVGTGTVVDVMDTTVTLACTFEEHVPTRPPVDLLLALPRPKVMKRLWAQLAALGVGRVILTNAERVERPYFDTHVLDPAVYRPLLLEGLQQARDTRVPVVSVHRHFRVLIEDELDAMPGDASRVVADPGGHPPLGVVLGTGTGRRVLLAVGPEGGWNDFERALLRAHGFVPASMGGRTLRTDTACVALLALAHAALDTTPGPQ